MYSNILSHNSVHFLSKMNSTIVVINEVQKVYITYSSLLDIPDPSVAHSTKESP